jgi:hypothetical protein
MAAEADRCPNCGALVVEGAEWCGQCYTPLKTAAEAEPETSHAPSGTETSPTNGDIPALPTLGTEASSGASAPGGVPASASSSAGLAPRDELAEPEMGTLGIDVSAESTAGTTWTCPSCDHKNPLDLDICALCGTPFSRLFSDGDVARRVEPDRAAFLSVVPGLGHWICGQHGEAATRFLFVVWGFAVGLLGLLAKTSAQYPGGAKLHPVGVVYILSALIVYGIGFVDAYRSASGHEQYLSVKILLYWFAALIFIFLISVFAAFLSVTKTRLTPGGGPSPA